MKHILIFIVAVVILATVLGVTAYIRTDSGWTTPGVIAIIKDHSAELAVALPIACVVGVIGYFFCRLR